MLSQTAEHALRAVVYLARLEGNERVPAPVIAAALEAPANYLSKILNVLARKGLLSSGRGRGGGFALARDPREVMLGEIVAVFDEMRVARSCLLGGRSCEEGSRCDLHVVWAGLREQTFRGLTETPLSALLNSELACASRACATHKGER